MAQSIPPVPRGLARDMAIFLEALRMAIGGDRATTAPTAQAEVLSPVSAVTVLAADLSPVPLSVGAADLAPVSEPCACDMGLEPV